MTFQLEVTASFSAAHAIVIGGVREPIHGHDWHTRIRVGGDRLDGEGLLLDFHALHHALLEIIRPFSNRSLNEVPPFNTQNPTAELVAKHLGDEITRRLPAIPGAQANGVRLLQVRLTEAVGCAAIYQPVTT